MTIARVSCKEKVGEFSVLANGKKTTVLVIDKNLALKSNIVSINGKKSLIFSDAVVLEAESGFELLNERINSFDIAVYPVLAKKPTANIGTITTTKGSPAFSSYRVVLPSYEFSATTKEISPRKFSVNLPQSIPAGVNELCLQVNYTGDTGMGFLNGELVADNFYNGIPWQIGLRKFLSSEVKPKEMVLYFRPMEKNATYIPDLQPYPQYIPDFGKSMTYLKMHSLSFIPQYKTTLKF